MGKLRGPIRLFLPTLFYVSMFVSNLSLAYTCTVQGTFLAQYLCGGMNEIHMCNNVTPAQQSIEMAEEARDKP